MKIKLFKANELLGIAGNYLYLCRHLNIDPIPLKVPAFGLIRTQHEIRNIHDNFLKNELRDPEVEKFLANKNDPVVIDCGINVGVTARWWFHLNKSVTVFGVDMLEEAHKFTIEALKSIGVSSAYKPIKATLYSEDGKEFNVGVSDPLCGDFGLYRVGIEKTIRPMVTKTLDTIFDPLNIKEVDLLKVDLEGAAGDAFKGAGRLLEKVRHVVFEVHNEIECAPASQVLIDCNFILRNITGRHLWWERKRDGSKDTITN